jgi:hypothetical protein
MYVQILYHIKLKIKYIRSTWHEQSREGYTFGRLITNELMDSPFEGACYQVLEVQSAV